VPSSSSIVEYYSGYNDLSQALDHLNKRLIATYTPETIRGGGLLVNKFFFIFSKLISLNFIEIL
jgi:hypothetical protein